MLYDLMKKQVPAHRITMGKKVVRTEEQDDRVIIYCSDDTKYEGEILVAPTVACVRVFIDSWKRRNFYRLRIRKDCLWATFSWSASRLHRIRKSIRSCRMTFRTSRRSSEGMALGQVIEWTDCFDFDTLTYRLVPLLFLFIIMLLVELCQCREQPDLLGSQHPALQV
ncbi:hypothetical protein BC939DRAFT_19628 [Gamsiella multidivaricata]|uniref:uncharacterized protein n=1 Tax=Gamsiella multidivaricata TaxID=101098 RepID=UPI00221E6D35|nr:uncharacterized protein BC939DRAFT_19628 [Gamsiella multidivaricata]KAI7817015.1 hypothetical protein BC939DRAFT_19628 [Gamsiella multidivaricata]